DTANPEMVGLNRQFEHHPLPFRRPAPSPSRFKQPGSYFLTCFRQSFGVQWRGVSICRIIVPSINVPAGPLVLYGSIPKTTFLFEKKDIARRYRRERVGLLALEWWGPGFECWGAQDRGCV